MLEQLSPGRPRTVAQHPWGAARSAGGDYMARRKQAGMVRSSRRNGSTGGDGFWDRPVLINLLADLLLLAGSLLLAWAGTMALQRLTAFPLRQLVVATPLDQVSRAQIEYTARGALAGCDTYLTKPVPFRALEAAVIKQMRRYLAIDDLSGMIRTATRPVAPAAPASSPMGVMARLFRR